MTDETQQDDGTRTGEDLLQALNALASRVRLHIVASLASEGRQYVSQLARDLGIGRPLLHMHLQRLEAAGLVVGHLELSPEGRAMKYFELTPFAIHIDAAAIVRAAASLGREEPAEPPTEATPPKEQP